ncbi:MAG: (Fe-S)-binding protein [Candidatus Lokiarchaeota archaeon]|nr:(Fe-S)-binding protein [Candidatus Lokiarchaeota archaeon]
MKTSPISSTEFSKFKEYYIKECKECGICFKNCFAYTNTEYPIHKNLKSLFKSNLDKKNVKRIKKFLNSCLYCKSCENSCKNELDLSVRLAAIKFELFKIDRKYTWLPHNIPSIFGKFVNGRRLAYLLRNLNNYLIPWKNREKFDKYRVPKTRDVIFFTGCGIQMLEDQYYTILEILIKLDINFGLIEGSFDKPVCCGAELIEYGQFEHGIYLLNNLFDEITKFNTKKVMVYCATCYYGLKKLAPQFIEDFDLEIIYAADYIAELLRKEENKELLNTLSVKSNIITIHDSCHLAQSGDTSSIRNLLSILPKISMSEMKHNKQNSICDLYCIIRELDNPLKLILKKDIMPIIDEAVESNADVLCSLCPGCHAFLTIFGDGLSSSLGLTKKRILVKNWVPILGEYLGIRKRDMLNYRLSHFITIPFKDSLLWYLLQILKAFVRGYIGLKEPRTIIFGFFLNKLNN